MPLFFLKFAEDMAKKRKSQRLAAQAQRQRQAQAQDAQSRALAEEKRASEAEGQVLTLQKVENS